MKGYNMEKQFRVSLWEEIGGFIYLMAENEREAKEKAQQILDDENIKELEQFNITHNETDILNIEEEE